MLFPGSNPESSDSSVYKLRVKDLLSMLAQEFPKQQGAVVLFGGLEQSCVPFAQESSFYYFTGINEPGAVAVFNVNGKSTLYVPNHGATRAVWVHTPIALTQENAKKLGFDTVTPLGQPLSGYQLYPFSDLKYYDALTADLNSLIKTGGKIFTLMPDNATEYVEQRWMIERLNGVINNLKSSSINISEFAALMRRKKDMGEIEKMYKAVEITILAQGAAAQAISEGIRECEVQASLEYMFIGSQAQVAFPSIVASGKNSTVLHYHTNSDELKNGQLVVVDIGARYQNYCADLTRTYPVSGTFTKRQKEIYNIVLACQEYIAGLAKPGMWLNNKEKPDQSLHHLAKKFFDERGYGKYFIHGIGHFVGMDVHDVGDLQQPLQDGDVFTIEPGLYIPEEQIGIRIEDNYWVVKDGVVCLSESLPKRAEDIEAFMQETEDEESEDFDIDYDMNQGADEGAEDEDLDLAEG
ncbi:MAG: Xaa-Pro aminopeptidase [Candidatus Babeliales bacterium]